MSTVHKVMGACVAAVLAVVTWLTPEIAFSGEICRECYNWLKATSGPDVAEVWCCSTIRYEVRGTATEGETSSVRKMLASISTSTGLTFTEVARGGDLIVITGANAFPEALGAADTDPEVSRFNKATPGNLLNGLLTSAILRKLPCSASELVDKDLTIHSAIVVTSNAALCLEITVETALGVHQPKGAKEDAAALCVLYSSYRRFARTFDDMNELLRNAALDCSQF